MEPFPDRRLPAALQARLIHFISQIISGSGPIFPAWLNLGRIMVPQEREEYEYSKKGEGKSETRLSDDT